jgi:hypothetical protein
VTVAFELCPGARVIGILGGAAENPGPLAVTPVIVMLELPAGEEFSRVSVIPLLLPIVTFPKSREDVLNPSVPFCFVP